MGTGTVTGRGSSSWPPEAHLHTRLLWVCLHGLQGRQGTTTLHDDPAVLRLAQCQHAQCRAALLTHLQQG